MRIETPTGRVMCLKRLKGITLDREFCTWAVTFLKA